MGETNRGALSKPALLWQKRAQHKDELSIHRHYWGSHSALTSLREWNESGEQPGYSISEHFMQQDTPVLELEGVFLLDEVERKPKRFCLRPPKLKKMADQPSNPKWLTEAAAAERLEVTAEDLRAMREKGEGPAYAKRGPLVRYNVEALDAWVSAMFEDADPDNSEGWEVVEAKTPVDVNNLYSGNPLAPKIPPATREGPSGILDPQGNPVAAKVLKTGVPFGRGEYDFINDYGQEMHAPNNFEGMEAEQIAGVKPTPQVIEQASRIGGSGQEVVSPVFKTAKKKGAAVQTKEMGGVVQRLAAPPLQREPGT